MNLQKTSFTILEVLMSLILISIIVSSFSKLVLNNYSNTVYNSLNKTRNSFVQDLSITTDFEHYKFIEH